MSTPYSWMPARAAFLCLRASLIQSSRRARTPPSSGEPNNQSLGKNDGQTCPVFSMVRVGFRTQVISMPSMICIIGIRLMSRIFKGGTSARRATSARFCKTNTTSSESLTNRPSRKGLDPQSRRGKDLAAARARLLSGAPDWRAETAA